MYGKFSCLLILVLLTVHGCSRFYYQPPLVKFKHEKHVDILFEQQKECAYCHILPAIDTLIQQGGEFKMTPELNKMAHELKIDGKCHSCHKDQTTKADKAPKNCVTCHENMKTMKPTDHVNNWKRMHSVPAGLDRKECGNCHKDWYCQSCHTQQKSLDNFMHSRTFRLKHSLEALVDPGSCGTCHRVSFCIDCHQRD